MACSETIRLANEDWPFYRMTDDRLCCYKVVVANEDAAAAVIADAQSQPDYAKHSPCSEAPEGKIQFYVYFRQQ